jgi:hypothetical protein
VYQREKHLSYDFLPIDDTGLDQAIEERIEEEVDFNVIPVVQQTE